MINTLTIGQQTYSNNLIQGPLAGVSSAPFRALVTRFSQPAFTCTEMISCKTLVHTPLASQIRYIAKDPEEGPLCYQLSGTDPDEVAEAVKRVTQYGADSINLNCGCPVKKIRTRGAGSRLLSEPTKLYHLMLKMKASTHLPVSIKIRVDGSSTDQFNHEIAAAVKEAGIDFLIVHGRHWTENYAVPCHYDEIEFFVNELPIPVIGNGDISSSQTLHEMAKTGCAGMMIARASVGQPWLIGKLIAEINQAAFAAPSLLEIKMIFLEHVEKLSALLQGEKFAVLQARKFAKYYGRPLADRSSFAAEINLCNSLADLQAVSQKYFG